MDEGRRGTSKSLFFLLLFVFFFGVQIDGYPKYEDALSKVILFFQGQRSGNLPLDQELTWRSNSRIFDGLAAHVRHCVAVFVYFSGSPLVDIRGGYYYAGDNERPEDMDTVRSVYSVSVVALQYRGAYSDSLGSTVYPFYCSYSGYKDELIWGAAWLPRATNDVSYLNLLKSLGGIDETDIFSWDNKFAGASVLLSR
ncbi:hypothetical protein IFM89_001897, partial [Coptis chinensis]